MKTLALQALKPLVIRQAKRFGLKVQHGADRIGTWLFPDPLALLGPRPATIEGPPVGICLMEGGDSPGPGPKPESAKKQDLGAQLLDIFRLKKTSHDLGNLEAALRLQQELGLDLAARALGIEFLCAWSASPDAIAAFILLPVKAEDLAGRTAEPVLKLIARRKNLDHFNLDPDFDTKQGSKYLKMLLLGEENLEVLLLKAADLFLELAHIGEPHPSAHIALESFAPLLKILGYSDHARELEDLAFACLKPDEFKSTESQTFDSYRLSRAMLIEDLKKLGETLASGLKELYPNVRISWRPKGIFSIYEKERTANDLFGIRVVVDSLEDCYMIRDDINTLISDEFERLPEQCDDHITRVKATGYRALHEALKKIKPAGESWQVEIQIRSAEMDYEAEVGSCSHLKYKLGPRGFDDISTEGSDAKAKYQDNRDRLISDGFVFAYDADGGLHKIGPVKPRASRASVLDFAFHCSRDAGSRCLGAEIERLGPDGKRETIHASFAAPIENGDRIRLRIANEPQPISDHRLRVGVTEIAAASLGLLKQGREIDLYRRFDELKEEGSNVFSRAVADWEAELLATFDKMTARPSLGKHFRFSLERVFRKLGFDNAGIFYTAIGLKGEKRAAFLREIIQVIKDSSVVIGYDNKEVDKGSADLHLLVSNSPGVSLRILNYLKRFKLQLRGISIQSDDRFGLLKINVRCAEHAGWEGFFRKIEDLYKDIPLVTSMPLRTPLKVETKLREDQLVDFIEDLLSLGGNITKGQAHVGTFSSKLIVQFDSVAFPIFISLDRIEAKLKKKGWKVTLTKS